MTDKTPFFRGQNDSTVLYLSTKENVCSEPNFCMYTQGIYFIVSLSTIGVTGSVSHRKPAFIRNLEFILLLLIKFPYFIEKSRDAFNSCRLLASYAMDSPLLSDKIKWTPCIIATYCACVVLRTRRPWERTMPV